MFGPTKGGRVNKILIVDDHSVVRRGLVGILTEDFGEAEIEMGVDGKSARLALKSADWDLILLDINLPDCSGLDLLREIHRSHPKLPVIILSAYAEEEFALHSYQLGASAYLDKKSAADELIVAVHRVMEGRRYVTSALAEIMAKNLGDDTGKEAHRQLSTRELQVLGMTAEGLTQKDIAAKLNLSVKTVSTYRSRIAEKLDLHSSVELTRYAIRHHLVNL